MPRQIGRPAHTAVPGNIKTQAGKALIQPGLVHTAAQHFRRLHGQKNSLALKFPPQGGNDGQFRLAADKKRSDAPVSALPQERLGKTLVPRGGQNASGIAAGKAGTVGRAVRRGDVQRQGGKPQGLEQLFAHTGASCRGNKNSDFIHGSATIVPSGGAIRFSARRTAEWACSSRSCGQTKGMRKISAAMLTVSSTARERQRPLSRG